MSPDVVIEGSELYHGDCFEVMPNLPPASVDMVFADIPYNITKAQWDKQPFDLPSMWGCLSSLVKPKAAIVMTACNPFMAILLMSNIRNYKHEWFWKKTIPSGHLNAKNMPQRWVENILVFGYGTVNYYPLKVLRDKAVPTYTNAVRKRKADAYPYEGIKEHPQDPLYKHPSQIISAGFRSKERGRHPTQKPIDLLIYLIKTYSLAGQVVLDFTMGSGSTGIATMETGRKFIGIEQDAKHFNTAVSRTEQIKDKYGDRAVEVYKLQSQ